MLRKMLLECCYQPPSADLTAGWGSRTCSMTCQCNQVSGRSTEVKCVITLHVNTTLCGCDSHVCHANHDRIHHQTGWQHLLHLPCNCSAVSKGVLLPYTRMYRMNSHHLQLTSTCRYAWSPVSDLISSLTNWHLQLVQLAGSCICVHSAASHTSAEHAA